MKRLAIFVPSLRGGGAERSMLTLANRLSEVGDIIDLVLVRAEGPYLSSLSPKVRLVDLNARSTLRSLPALVGYLRRERPHAMLAAMSHANVIAVAARILSGVPTRLVISERNTPSRDLAALPTRIRILTKNAMRWAYPRADLVTAVSNGVADDLSKVVGLPRAGIKVIYNPIVSDELLIAAQSEPPHPWLQGAKGSYPPVILSVGRLTAQKDFGTLIHAFADVRKQCEAKLIILGEGELRGELESLIAALGLEQDVSLPGFAENPFSYMRKCSAYALSSQWEGLPGALIQAMACGAPVVATDCPSGPAEILENGRWGRIVPVADKAALAASLLATLRDPNPPDVTARAQFFAIDTAVQEYLIALYGHDLARRG